MRCAPRAWGTSGSWGMQAHAPGARRLLEFGCGRGWFLEEARSAGYEVAGADTSEVAVRLLAEKASRTCS
jgi:2-polyprenyl-3-methyl-5-hydroxy-6-metoxy-1,4-benzoquinol methylase